MRLVASLLTFFGTIFKLLKHVARRTILTEDIGDIEDDYTVLLVWIVVRGAPIVVMSMRSDEPDPD